MQINANHWFYPLFVLFDSGRAGPSFNGAVLFLNTFIRRLGTGGPTFDVLLLFKIFLGSFVLVTGSESVGTEIWFGIGSGAAIGIEIGSGTAIGFGIGSGSFSGSWTSSEGFEARDKFEFAGVRLELVFLKLSFVSSIGLGGSSNNSSLDESGLSNDNESSVLWTWAFASTIKISGTC